MDEAFNLALPPDIPAGALAIPTVAPIDVLPLLELAAPGKQRALANPALAAEACAIETGEPESSLTMLTLLRSMPAWFVSFLLHSVLLLSLAIWTHAAATGTSITLSAVLTEEVGLDELDIRLDQVGSMSGAAAMDVETLQEVSLPPLPISESTLQTFAELDAEMASTDGEALWGTSNGDDELGLDPAGVGTSAETAGDGEQAKFFGVSARGKKFVFIVDCSGSMGGSRWIAARNELIRSLRELQPEQSFVVMLYSSNVWTPEGRLSDAVYNEATPENLEQVTSWLNFQAPGGGTLPMPAVKESLRLLPDAVFLLSDGELQDDSRGFLRRYNGRTNGKKDEKSLIPVHTIAIGMAGGAELLAAIARENSGLFQHVW